MTRGCFIGTHEFACSDLGIDGEDDAASHAFSVVAAAVRSQTPNDRRLESFTYYLETRGHTACAELVNSVIASRRAEGGARA